MNKGAALRAALLVTLFILPLLLALMVGAEDQATLAEATLPVLFYYLFFFAALALAAAIVWTVVLAAHWAMSKLKVSEDAQNG